MDTRLMSRIILASCDVVDIWEDSRRGLSVLPAWSNTSCSNINWLSAPRDAIFSSVGN